MIIRPATEADLPMINRLIRQQENRFLGVTNAARYKRSIEYIVYSST
ncbi:hypothetical protein [Enterococcus sp. AZ033]